jgi:hypothetical protein
MLQAETNKEDSNVTAAGNVQLQTIIKAMSIRKIKSKRLKIYRNTNGAACELKNTNLLNVKFCFLDYLTTLSELHIPSAVEREDYERQTRKSLKGRRQGLF